MVKIFTDTASNIPMTLLQQYNIGTVPLTYEVNGAAPDMTKEFDGASFYRAMRAGDEVKTSMVNPQLASDAFEQCLKAGDDVLYLGISSGISGTCWGIDLVSQEMAKNYEPRRVVVINTRGASLGEGLVVLETAELARQGKSLDELVSFARSRCGQMQQYFVVDDLKYLHRGGRISGGARLAGSLLQIKPILQGNEEGEIILNSKFRGKKRALEALVEKYNYVVQHKAAPIGISHSDAAADALRLPDWDAKIANLSGGERRRVALCRLLLEKPDMLLLDEPTNHLDLDMRQALTEALIEFEGALVVVSHDRHLLRSTTDDLYLVHDRKVEPFDGDLEDYQQWLSDVQKQENQTDDAPKENANSAQARKDQKRREAELRAQTQPLRKEIARLEKEMEKLNAQLAQAEEKLGDSELYDQSRKAELTACLQQQASAKSGLEECEMAWLEAQEQLEQMLLEGQSN